MANLIDTTYFKAIISVPLDENQNTITDFITLFEPEILKKALGYDLYKAFIAGLDEEPIASKWTNLRDGAEWTEDGQTYKWRGMLNSTYDSFIAYYVFYQYLIYNSTFNSSSGVASIASENSNKADHRSKQMLVYNRMVDLISEMDDYINYQNSIDSTTYPDYEPESIRKINVFNV